MQQVETIDPTTVLRRRHCADLNAQVLRDCERPGALVAATAMAHGLIANLVLKWRDGPGPAVD